MNNNTFQYNGTDITFLSANKEVMVNATEMAKTFGKQPSDWSKTKSAQDFIDSLSAVRKIVRTDLIRVLQGGNMQGTWMHEDVALEFARWLSPSFAIWCNDRIKELMRYGMTATQTTLEAMVDNPDLIIQLATKLKEERAEKERLQLTVETQTKELVEAAPKLEYYDKTLNSSGLLTINMVALHLGISANKLNKLLVAWKVQYKQTGTYFLCSQYRDKGYADHRPHPYTNSAGEILTRQHLYWTEKGKEFIIRLYNHKMVA